MSKKPHNDPADAATDTAPNAPEQEDAALVAMTKDGVTLKVHPSCVDAHARIGWKVRA